MALKGRIEDFKLPEIFKLIQSGDKTGTLLLDDGANKGAVLFDKGNVIFSHIGTIDIGLKLVNCKLISEATLKYIQKEEAEKKSSLIKILIDQNFVSKKKLIDFLETHTKDTLGDMLGWVEGDFDFEIDEKLVNDFMLGQQIDINDVIDTAKEKLAAWKKIQKVIPDSRAIIHLSANGIKGKDEIVFTPIEWKIVAEVDGRRSVSEIASICSIDRFTVSKILYRMAKDSMITVTPYEMVAKEVSQEEIDSAKVIPINQKEQETVSVKDKLSAGKTDETSGTVTESPEAKPFDYDEDEEDDYEPAQTEEEIEKVSEIEKLKKITENFKGKKDITSMSYALEELTMLSKEEEKEEEEEKKEKAEKEEEKSSQDTQESKEARGEGQEKPKDKDKKEEKPKEKAKEVKELKKTAEPKAKSQAKKETKEEVKKETKKDNVKKAPPVAMKRNVKGPKHAKKKEPDSSNLINKFFGNLKKSK